MTRCLIGAVDREPRTILLRDDTRKGPGHSLVFAGPDSMKSTTAVTRLWKWQGPRVVFDPSLEIGAIMTEGLQEHGFDVHTIGLGARGIDALDWIDLAHPEVDVHIRTVVDWIYDDAAAARGSNTSKDPFWSTWGRSLIACMLAYMLFHPDRTVPKTLEMLRRGIATPENELAELLKHINRTSLSQMARDLAAGLMGMRAEETFSGIYANAFSATEWLSVGVYAETVSGGRGYDPIPTSKVIDPRSVIFVQLPLQSVLVTKGIAKAVMGALFNALFMANARHQCRTLFELDEAWLLGPMPEIKLFHVTARKYRGVLQSIMQSESQLEEVWGDKGAATMRDTCSWRSYGAVQDGKIAERLSRDMGTFGVQSYSEGENEGASRPWGLTFGSRSQGRNVNKHEIKRAVMMPHEILRMPADEIIVLARDFAYPFVAYAAPYFRYPLINQYMAANRFAVV